jgi:tetratricopeptide (TPR) repeat protein
MALGFGFNKAKVLASAEKFVQTGKLQNAIAEYEKIVKEDPKDLTVLNTLGDLCARVGQNENAAHYFKKVGDHYAQDGFTVKAIAVYKKLTRLTPGDFDSITKLADLYSQQGLASDARAQYMQVADHLLKSGDNAKAARVFQRILELDPENNATQAKLADLYLKLGKKAEACKIYYTAAETLYARSSFDAANEALNRVIELDPHNGQALLLRGFIAADAGDSATAIRLLGQVGDLDSRPDALRVLLRAQMQAGSMEGAESVATKLVAVHNDLSGVSALAQWYVGNSRIDSALKLYDNYADRFMASDKAAFEEAVYPLINRVKEDPHTLSLMSRMLQRAGDSSHNAEIMELQAHAFAQKGDYRSARDLYKKLAEVEPENALHSQNHKQMLSKLGEDPATRVLSADEAAQAFMVEELEQAAPSVHQTYDPPTERAIEAALTDAELFVSYNVPAKAIPPLEAVLPLAPRDVTVNQRLATLYARGGRYAEASRACQVLSEVYRETGHEMESGRYLEAARNYALRVPGTPAIMPASAPVAVAEAAVAEAVEPPHSMPEAHAVEVDLPADQGASSVQEFSFDVPDHLFNEAETSAAPAHSDTQPIHVEEIAPPAAEPAAFQAEPASAKAASSEAEIDVSSEWEDMVSVEADASPSQPAAAEMEVVSIREEQPVVAEQEDGGSAPCYAAAEKIQEAQFYLAQQMWDAAKKAILDLTEIAPDAPEITELIAAVSSGQSRAAAAAAEAAAAATRAPEPALRAPSRPAPEPPAQRISPAAQAAEEFAVEVEAEPVFSPEPVTEFEVETFASREPAPVAASTPKPAVISPAAPPPAPVVVKEKPSPVASPPAKVSPPAPTPVSDDAPLEDILTIPVEIAAPDLPPPPPPPAPVVAAPIAPAPAVAPPPAMATPAPAVAAFAKPAPAAPPPAAPLPVESLLDDILEVEPRPAHPAAPAPAAPAASKEKSTEDILTDFVSDMEKSELADFVPRAKPDPPPPPKSPAVTAAAPDVTPAISPAAPQAPPAPAEAPVFTPPASAAPAFAAPTNGDMRDHESASALNDILSALQEETGEETEPEGDPEIHYNLGIAFKEMGLLDEAIGELQKVCRAMDNGKGFSQPIQAYTWLAQCLVDKGVPEAAVRWYKQALQLPRLDDGSRCAIYYDLATAYEASGDKKSALNNFMEVYGSNIDFRDVASRIKALKS